MNNCVFCGKAPEEKNLEHIVPKWLMELTGGFNRKIIIPSLNSKNKSIDILSFKFPACKKCNDKYLDIEAKTKSIVIKLIKKEAISSREVETLMDWLDKVRIGLWQGSLMWSKNPQSINPKFFISNRFRKDRILYIAQTDKPFKGLNFSSFNDILFQNIPCYLMIRINEIVLISISNDFILSGIIPLPNFVVKKYNLKTGELKYSINRFNRQKITIPYIGKKYSTILQINYPFNVNSEYLVDLKKFFNNDGLSSKILMIKSKKIEIYPTTPSNNWQAEKHESIPIFIDELYKKFYFLRNWTIDVALKDNFNEEINKLHKIVKQQIINQFKSKNNQ